MATTIYVREDRLQRVRFDPSTDERRLRRLTVLAGGLLVVQALAVAVLAEGSSVPVTMTDLDRRPGSVPDLRQVGEVPVGPAVTGLLLGSGALHLVVARGRGFEAYVRDLRRGRNRLRWIEHALSSSAIVVLVALLAGISDVAALIGLFALVAAAAVLARPGEVGRPVPAWPLILAGVVPGVLAWMTVAAYLWWPGPRGQPPAFVGRLYVSMVVLYLTVAVNQWLQCARVGPWRGYGTGEVASLALGVAAKSALAWQVVAHPVG